MNATFENIKIFEEFESAIPNNIEAFIAVPYIYIEQCCKVFPKKIKIAAQDLSAHEKGPFTGEISVQSLKEFKIEYVIIGHSERRIYHKETDEEVNQKMKIALNNGIRPVLCIGEPLDIRNSGKYLNFVISEFLNSSKNLQNSSFDVAYEPIWSVGTGITAKNNQISEVILKIKDLMKENNIKGRVIYGGSVSKDNVDELKKIESLDGFLIGNASLDHSFIDIIGKFSNIQ